MSMFLFEQNRNRNRYAVWCTVSHLHYRAYQEGVSRHSQLPIINVCKLLFLLRQYLRLEMFLFPTEVPPNVLRQTTLLFSGPLKNTKNNRSSSPVASEEAMHQPWINFKRANSKSVWRVWTRARKTAWKQARDGLTATFFPVFHCNQKGS